MTEHPPIDDAVLLWIREAGREVAISAAIAFPGDGPSQSAALYGLAVLLEGAGMAAAPLDADATKALDEMRAGWFADARRLMAERGMA